MNSPRATFLRAGVLDAPRKAKIRNSTLRRTALLLVTGYFFGFAMGFMAGRSSTINHDDIDRARPQPPPPATEYQKPSVEIKA